MVFFVVVFFFLQMTQQVSDFYIGAKSPGAGFSGSGKGCLSVNLTEARISGSTVDLVTVNW